MVLLEIVIVIVGVGAELQLLYLDDVLLLLAPRATSSSSRTGSGRNRWPWRPAARQWARPNQIETQLLRTAQRRRSRHHFCGAIRKYGADFSSTDRFVYVFAAIGFARREVAAWNHAVSRLFPNIVPVYPLFAIEVQMGRQSVEIGSAPVERFGTIRDGVIDQSGARRRVRMSTAGTVEVKPGRLVTAAIAILTSPRKKQEAEKGFPLITAGGTPKALRTTLTAGAKSSENHGRNPL